MSAALFAAIRGAKTLLVEKTDFVGGTSAFSAGSIWIPNTRHASVIGASDSAANVERYLQQIVGNRADTALRASFSARRSRSGRCVGKSFRGQIARLCASS